MKQTKIIPMTEVKLEVNTSSTKLVEKNSYDVAEVRIKMVDENGNQLYFSNEPLKLSVEGPIEIIGPDTISLKGRMFGTYVKTTGEAGNARLTIESSQADKCIIDFSVEV